MLDSLLGAVTSNSGLLVGGGSADSHTKLNQAHPKLVAQILLIFQIHPLFPDHNPFKYI